MTKKLLAVDLFSGAGGLSEGLRQAGFTVVGAIDNDPAACKAYRLNHPKVKLWERDIRRLTGVAVLRDLGLATGELDLLAACPPCQGFSTMRTRNGTKKNRDFRNDLIFDVLRLVRSMRPKTIMLENVPGLARNKRFNKFCHELITLGYDTKWDVLNAVNYAVPQNRRRLVLLASREGQPEFAAEAKVRTTVRDFISGIESPEKSDDPLHNYDVRRSPKVAALIKKIPRDGGSRKSLGSANQLACHRRLRGFWDVYGRMSWDKPAPTITGGCINPSKGRFIHPTANRAITLREAALLQTFPPKFQFPMEKGRYAVALLIGNALPPEFIRRHAMALIRSALTRKH